ncbi:HEAT repeat domain-containing protein [Kitasatospora sp. NPDC006786]|uniref:HEAT repeat domain-containing protein n=1 Tax=unclassified Kitasatospora TaxID=2633591 RepID=UPI0034014321
MTELVGQALGAQDRHACEGLLRRAAEADGRGAVARALDLLGSPRPVERALGCDLLGFASDAHEDVRAGAADALVALAARESEPEVLRSLARALDRTQDRRAVPVLVALAGHRDPEVRQRTAIALGGFDSGLPDGPDVRALIALARDPDPEVRNWATFSLGFQSGADTPAVRAALWERTRDAGPDVRAEGVRGLARRRDPRATAPLSELLADPDGAEVLTFRAAEILGAPELLPLLEDYDPDDHGVAEALAACDPARKARLDEAAWALVRALERLRPELSAAVWATRCEPGLTLGLGSGPDAPGYDAPGAGTPGPDAPGYDVGALLARAGHDPLRAAELVCGDHPVTRSDRTATGHRKD